MSRPEPSLARREVGLCVLAAGALAVVMTWPLALHMGSELPSDPVNVPDVLLEAWTVAWGGHALIHAPLHFFNANVFWPLGSTLAFTDSLAGYAPAGLVGHGAEAATTRYDLLFLFAYALPFVGAYLLARELGARVAGASVAGAAFAYAPFRLAHQSHLHVLSSGGIPLSLFLLVRGYRRRRGVPIVCGWLVALWQISLGWNLGLPFAYLLAVLAAGAIVLWLRAGRSAQPRVVWAATLGGTAVLVAGTLLLALPYIHVLSRHPEARRTPDLLFYFSPTGRGLLAAPSEDLVWGRVTAALRVVPAGEKTLFPGATVLVLGLVGLVYGRRRRALRAGLACAFVAICVLALGFGFHGGQASYRILYDYFPGWQGLRTPGRLIAFAALALCLLAAIGADRVVDVARAHGGRLAAATGALLVGLVLLEGYGTIGRTPVPAIPSLPRGAPPILVLPPTSDLANATAMFWSVDGFPAVANGWSGFHPNQFVTLTAESSGFPDAASIRAIRAYGVHTVVLDRALARGTPWQSALTRPIRGLGITRSDAGPLVYFTLSRAP